MELSLYTLVTKDFSLEESIEMAADAGYQAVDIRQNEDGCHITPDVKDDELRQIRAMVEDAGLKISGLTTYWEVGVSDVKAARHHQEGLQRGCQIAQILGAHLLRCSAADLDLDTGYETQRKLFRDQFMQAAEYGAEYDVTINFEQHSRTMGASAGQILDLTRGLPTEHIGIVYDPGNTIVEGFERVSSQVEMLRHLIKAVHVKNLIIESVTEPQECFPFNCVPLDSGFLQWPAIINQLKRIGYDGYLTLEELVLHDRFDSVGEMIAWDAQYLQSLQ